MLRQRDHQRDRLERDLDRHGRGLKPGAGPLPGGRGFRARGEPLLRLLPRN